MIKIPTLGIHTTVKFLWIVRPFPLGLEIDRCIRHYLQAKLNSKIKTTLLLIKQAW